MAYLSVLTVTVRLGSPGRHGATGGSSCSAPQAVGGRHGGVQDTAAGSAATGGWRTTCTPQLVQEIANSPTCSALLG